LHRGFQSLDHGLAGGHAERAAHEIEVLHRDDDRQSVELAEAEEARAALRDQWASDPSDDERAQIVRAAIPLVERQLALVRDSPA